MQLITTVHGTFTDRQRKILDVLNRGGYAPCSIGDLVDDDFCDLLNRDLVGVYVSQGAGRRCHITEAGIIALSTL